MGIAKSARVTKWNKVACRLVISACNSEPMMNSYISSALLVIFSRSSGETFDKRSSRMSKRLMAIGYSMSAASETQSLPSRGWPGANIFRPPSSRINWRWLSRMTSEHSPRDGALHVLGDEVSAARSSCRRRCRQRSNDATFLRAAEFRPESGVARVPANGVPSRKGEGSSRLRGSSSFGGFAYFARGTPEMR